MYTLGVLMASAVVAPIDSFFMIDGTLTSITKYVEVPNALTSKTLDVKVSSVEMSPYND